MDELVRQLVLGIHRVVGGMGEKGRRVDWQLQLQGFVMGVCGYRISGETKGVCETACAEGEGEFKVGRW